MRQGRAVATAQLNSAFERFVGSDSILHLCLEIDLRRGHKAVAQQLHHWREALARGFERMVSVGMPEPMRGRAPEHTALVIGVFTGRHSALPKKLLEFLVDRR